MRITFILPQANMSGGIKVVAIYAKLLEKRGHSVVLISHPPRKIPLVQRFKSLIKGRGWGVSIKSRKSHLDGTGLDHRILKRDCSLTDASVPDADVIIATWWETAEWVNSLSDCKGAKVYFIQGHEVFEHLPVERSKATFYFPMHKIVVAKWLQDVMCSLYRDFDVTLIPNSVDHNQFFSDTRGKQSVPTVGFLYSHAKVKGVDITLQALRILKKLLPNLRIITFGSVHPKWDKEKSNGIEFQYSPPQGELRRIYAECDVWITASRNEGFNLPAMEAMACRTPVVSTKAGWPQESVVDGKNGYLVDVDDTDELARCVYEVLSLPDSEWQAMSKCAYETVKNSSWEASTDLFEMALNYACQRAERGEIAGTRLG